MITAITPQLSNRINSLSESATIAMSVKSRELAAQGVDVISLSLGEPDFNTPDFIKEAAKQAIDNNYSHYMPVPGYQELREAISNKFKRDNNLNYAPNQIVVSTGAKQSIANVMLSLVNPGDEVLLPCPYWVTYHEIVKLAGAVPVPIPTTIDTDFKVTGEMLREYITPNTRAVLFSTPCNPSGSVWTREELRGIAEVVAEHENMLIFCDEIYEHIVYTGKHESMAQFDFIYDRTVTINGVSKGFAMTGWRVGYIGAPKWIADACIKMQGQFTSGTCGIAQKAAQAAVEADPSAIAYMREAFLKRRELVRTKLQQIPGIRVNEPKGAFYIFPDVSHYFGSTFGDEKIENATDLSMYLLNHAHVAVVTGEAFGDARCIRFSYAASEETLTEAVARIAKALGNLTLPA